MIIHRVKKIYSKRELDEYIHSLPYSDTDEAIRELGYINASAFKGYGALTDEMATYNALVYRTKQEAMEILAEKANDVVFCNGVLYFRLTNGIQISFHVDKNVRHNVFLKYQSKAEWDGVKDSYTYDDVEAYNVARQEYLDKVEEDKAKKVKREEVVLATIRKYLANGNRRKSLGITMTTEEFKVFNPFVKWGFLDIMHALCEFGVEPLKALYIEQQIIDIIGESEWEELNNFHINE